MKRVIKLVVVLMVAVVAMACNQEKVGIDYLDVTPNNISGVWRMESYDNGVQLSEGSYYYIVFDRAERTFVTYDNLESMGLHKNSGRYDIRLVSKVMGISSPSAFKVVAKMVQLSKVSQTAVPPLPSGRSFTMLLK